MGLHGVVDVDPEKTPKLIYIDKTAYLHRTNQTKKVVLYRKT